MYCFHKKVKVKKSADLYEHLKKVCPNLTPALFTTPPAQNYPTAGCILKPDDTLYVGKPYSLQPCHAYVRDMPTLEGATIVSSFDWTVTPKEYIKFLFGKDSPWLREFFDGGLEVRCYLDHKKRFTHYTIKMKQVAKYRQLVANFCIATRLFTEHKNTCGLLWLDLLDTGKVDAIGAYKMLALYSYTSCKNLTTEVSTGHFPINKNQRLEYIRHKGKFLNGNSLNVVWGTGNIYFTPISEAMLAIRDEKKGYTSTFNKMSSKTTFYYSPEFLSALVNRENIAAFINE